MIETELIAGLYDENDNLIVTYEESGLIAGTNYTSTSYRTAPGSGYSTFNRYPAAKKVILPVSLASIGDYVFSSCLGLTSVTISSSVTSIGYNAFRNCSNLASITIPDSVTSIGSYAFSHCTGLTSVTIPESVTSIDNYAFESCRGLTMLELPDSLTYLSAQAFSGCSTLQELRVGGGLSELSMDHTDYDNGLYIDLSSAYNLETVSVRGNVYFGPAMQWFGSDYQFEASDDGSLYKWNNDLDAWELVWLMPEAVVLPSYFDDYPIVSILANCIDYCHTNMFDKDLVIPDTVKLLDMRLLEVWSDNFSSYNAKHRIHLLASSVTTLVDSGDTPWQDIIVNVPASLAEAYSQTWTESWVQQIVGNDSLLAFVAYNQNLQEDLPKKFVSVEEVAKLQDELQEQQDTIDEQQSLIETLQAELKNTKPVIAHLSYSYDTGTGKWTCDHTLDELLQVADAGGTIKLYVDAVLLYLSSYWDGGLHFVQVVAPNQSGWYEFNAHYGEESEGQIPEIWEDLSHYVE